MTKNSPAPLVPARSAAELGWVAGFFCGEGTTSAHRQGGSKRYYLHVGIGNTDRSCLERCQCILGGKLYGPYSPRSTIGKKPMYQLKISGGSSPEEALGLLWPLLSEEKREQAERARALVASNPPPIPHKERAWREKRVAA